MPGQLRRGRRVYGVDVGVIMLDIDLPRPVGDVGNGRSFNFPVHYEPAFGASAENVVEHHASGLLENFVAAAERLTARGARALSTTCGFLAALQRELADRAEVPVATSSLLQIPLVLHLLATEKRLAVITINSSTLEESHFRGVGMTEQEIGRVSVVGLERTEHTYPVIMGDEEFLDPERAGQEVLAVCQQAMALDPNIAAFIFECANLPPYSQLVRDVTGLPVWDTVTMIRWMQDGLNSPVH